MSCYCCYCYCTVQYVRQTAWISKFLFQNIFLIRCLTVRLSSAIERSLIIQVTLPRNRDLRHLRCIDLVLAFAKNMHCITFACQERKISNTFYRRNIPSTCDLQDPQKNLFLSVSHTTLLPTPSKTRFPLLDKTWPHVPFQLSVRQIQFYTKWASESRKSSPEARPLRKCLNDLDLIFQIYFFCLVSIHQNSIFNTSSSMKSL